MSASRPMRPSARTAALLALALLASCRQATSGGSVAGAPRQAGPGVESMVAMPLGDVAGAATFPSAPSMGNPYEGNPRAVTEGHELFVRMNCAGCHGYEGKGGMGPNLTDGYWRYGGVPASIFKSIYEGRPQGMPAWNPSLPPQDIWKLVAYVQSLGGAYPAGERQAAMLGDRAGDNVAPGVERTLPERRIGLPAGRSTPGTSSPGTSSPGTSTPSAPTPPAPVYDVGKP
ncbi:MAG: c-type cytochrome [Caldimonas sp.]